MASYDEKINKLFFWWIFVSFCLVFLIVIVGGLTRLTNSGLSITKWELFTGILPPLNSETWSEYFKQYKTIPQYEIINKNMTLSEFKVIFYWEYFHRLLARFIGVFFLIPLLFFYYSNKVKNEYIKTSFFVFFLIVFQGIVGWYMVESGLVTDITVSHYRLSLHLITAFVIISILFWCLLNLNKKTNENFFHFKKYSLLFVVLFVFLLMQIIVGAFVSGLDAGNIYQTWPRMNYNFFPDDVVINNLKDFFNFENHGLIQFYHRNIAYLICIYLLFVGYFIFKKKMRYLFESYYLVLLTLFIQIFLGIITLTSGLNIYIASTHQICGLLLILSIINLYHKYINY